MRGANAFTVDALEGHLGDLERVHNVKPVCRVNQRDDAIVGDHQIARIADHVAGNPIHQSNDERLERRGSAQGTDFVGQHPDQNMKESRRQVNAGPETP